MGVGIGEFTLLRSRLAALRRFIAAERSTHVPMALLTQLRAWRQGFTTASVALYGPTRWDTGEYVSDYAAYRAAYIDEPYAGLSSGKLVFEAVMGRYLPVPKSLAIIAGGRICPVGQGVEEGTVDTLIRLAREQDGIVLKPVAGEKGQGVMVLREKEGGLCLNERPIAELELATLVGSLDHYLASERVRQAAYARELFPGSANTIRLVTMVDPFTQEPFIAIAAHRIGTWRSAPVDNCCCGGMSAAIDLDTGTLGPAAERASGKLIWHEKHPEVGVQIEGVQIANWQLVKESILRTLRRMPYLRYVGWDVVVTDDGFRVLEANNTPGAQIQVHGPLLKDPRVRQFLKHHQVL